MYVHFHPSPDFGATIRRLLRDPVVIYSNLADFFSLSCGFAVYMFLPKYLEHQFRVDKSTAVLYTGS